MIVDKYDGSVRPDDISICQESYNNKKEFWIDHRKTLFDLGLSADGSTYKLIYDFIPISYPLLNTPLADIVDKSKK